MHADASAARVPVFRAVLVVGVIVLIVYSVVVGGIALRRSREAVHEFAVRTQSAHAILIRQLLRDVSEQEVKRVMSALAQHSQIRFALVSPDGTVVVDTAPDASTIQNQRTQPEIAEALAGRVGWSIRHTPADGQMFYVALPAAGGPFIVRTHPRAHGGGGAGRLRAGGRGPIDDQPLTA